MLRGYRRCATKFAEGQGPGCGVRNASGPISRTAEAPVTFGSELLITQDPETPDLVPSESSAASIIEPVGASSFPKVLRRRLDKFFSDQNITHKADRTMWVKIAVGLAVLVGAWIALYALRPD